MDAALTVVEVLGYGSDPDTGAPVRRVRFSDGSAGVQHGKVTVEGTITRADGSVEPGAPITDIQVRPT